MKAQLGTAVLPLRTALVPERATQQTSPCQGWIVAMRCSIFAIGWWSITYGRYPVPRAAYSGPSQVAGPIAVSGHSRRAHIGNHSVAGLPGYVQFPPVSLVPARQP